MTGLFLSFTPIHTLRGKAATAAGGRERERLCGGEWERKDARQGDAERRFRRVGKSLSLRMTAQLSF